LLSKGCTPEKQWFFILKVTGKLKTFNLMANIKLVFQGTEESSTEKTELECFLNSYGNQITISLIDTSCGQDYNTQFISLDKSTAIKFAKTLRTEINKIQS
jgi:hypothetical protein